MLHHIVMWKLKDFAEGKSKKANAVLMKAELESLLSEIDQIKKLEVGINIENPAYPNFDIVLDTWFESYAAMEAYQVHPMHKKVSEWVGKVRETRAVVDYEV